MPLCRKDGWAGICVGCDGKRCVKGRKNHDESRSSSDDGMEFDLVSVLGAGGISDSSCATDSYSSTDSCTSGSDW